MRITSALCKGIGPNIRAPRNLLCVSDFFINYPFAERLFPDAIKVIEHVQQWGPAVILSDGDVVFQPLKISRSGLANAVSGRVLIYVHKEQELDDVEQRYPAKHYVLVDDKLRILAAVKKFWGSRVTTIFVRQGHYAADPKILASYPPADISIERIGGSAAISVAGIAESETVSDPAILSMTADDHFRELSF